MDKLLEKTPSTIKGDLEKKILISFSSRKTTFFSSSRLLEVWSVKSAIRCVLILRVKVFKNL